MTVLIRGKLYPSVAAAAKSLRVAKSTIYVAMMRGSLDRVGLGIDYRKRKWGGGRRRPVTIAGKTFATIVELADAIGRNPKSVRTSLLAGERARARIALAVMKLNAKQENAAMRAVMNSANYAEPRKVTS